MTVNVGLGFHQVLEAPAPNASLTQPFTISGWALENASSTGTGVDWMWFVAHPLNGGPDIFFGHGVYGDARPDVAAIYGSRFLNSGYHLNVGGGMTPGPYELRVYAHDTVTGGLQAPATVTVNVGSGVHQAFEAPAANATVSTPFTIQGWAIDAASPTGTGVDFVWIELHRQALGATPMALGNATYGGARPNVAATYGSRFLNSGFTITVGPVPAGIYTIKAYPHSVVDGLLPPQTRVITIQ